MSDAIDFIEAHDAEIASIAFSPDGRCTIAFSHVAVYFPTATKPGEDEAFEIWSYPARLVVDGVTQLRCNGSFTGERVMDGEIFAPEGSAVAWARLRDHSAVKRLELQLFGGTEIAISCEGAQLTLGERGEYLERWSGPL